MSVSSIKKDRTVLNVASTITLQIITLLSGFLVPKFILDAFGSQINGLVSSITQFLGYISLVEGGVGAVILANLYGPLANNDSEKISAVIVTANRFFKHLALIFLGYEIGLAIIYPFFIKTQLSWGYIASLTLIMGVSTFIQYYFAISWKLMLQADRKMFVAAFVQGLAVILNLFTTVIIIRVLPNIHMVKLIGGVLYFIQPIILNRYVKKHYVINPKVKSDSELLKQRWDGFGINIASMVHASTATIVLTLLTGLESVSVLSVYLLVVNGLKSLITSISSGVIPTIGTAYAKGDLRECNKMFDLYDTIMFFVSFLCYTIAAITISHFTMLYTASVTDANYWQPALGAILSVAECMFCIREPYVNMAYSAGDFRQVSKYAYMEAILNVVLSVIFTLLFGMIGVAIGLLISITYRTLMQVWYTQEYTIRRPVSVFLKKLISFSSASAVCAFVSIKMFHMGTLSVGAWILYAFKVSVIEIICLIIASVISCQSEYRIIKKILHYGNKTVK